MTSNSWPALALHRRHLVIAEDAGEGASDDGLVVGDQDAAPPGRSAREQVTGKVAVAGNGEQATGS